MSDYILVECRLHEWHAAGEAVASDGTRCFMPAADSVLLLRWESETETLLDTFRMTDTMKSERRIYKPDPRGFPAMIRDAVEHYALVGLAWIYPASGSPESGETLFLRLTGPGGEKRYTADVEAAKADGHGDGFERVRQLLEAGKAERWLVSSSSEDLSSARCDRIRPTGIPDSLREDVSTVRTDDPPGPQEDTFNPFGSLGMDMGLSMSPGMGMADRRPEARKLSPSPSVLDEARKMEVSHGPLLSCGTSFSSSGMTVDSYKKHRIAMEWGEDGVVVRDRTQKGQMRPVVTEALYRADPEAAEGLLRLIERENLAGWKWLPYDDSREPFMTDYSFSSGIFLIYDDSRIDNTPSVTVSVNIKAADQHGGRAVTDEFSRLLRSSIREENLISQKKDPAKEPELLRKQRPGSAGLAEDSETGWICRVCGNPKNSGKFCTECGEPRFWTCPECGSRENTGKFCPECGARKP